MFDFSRLHLEDPEDKKKAKKQIEEALEFDKVQMDENDKQLIYHAILNENCITNESLFFNLKCEPLQTHLNKLGYFILAGKLDALENELQGSVAATATGVTSKSVAAVTIAAPSTAPTVSNETNRVGENSNTQDKPAESLTTYLVTIRIPKKDIDAFLKTNRVAVPNA